MLNSKIAKDFPILNRKINGKALVYLDNAATSQKPRQVLAAMTKFYEHSNANVHRGIHSLSVEATEVLENGRKKVAEFVGISDPAEIIFVKNATEAINLVAFSLGQPKTGIESSSYTIEAEDEIVLTQMEHHSNIVPWQVLAKSKGAVCKFLPVGKDGLLVFDEPTLKKFINKKTKILALTHVSNVLGTINPISEIVKKVRRINPKVLILVDGSQAVPHMPVDIKSLNCDFYVFTGHKMLGPMGIGVLWARKELLSEMPPFLTGGEMISEVSFEKSTWNELPWKFEAGTPNVSGVVGLAAAIDYLSLLGMDKIRIHEQKITQYALDRLSGIEKVTIFGPKKASLRGGVISFNYANIHAHDVASILDLEGVAIRSGHHCAQPLMSVFNVSSMARASFYVYNDQSDIDKLIIGLKKVDSIFGKK